MKKSIARDSMKNNNAKTVINKQCLIFSTDFKYHIRVKFSGVPVNLFYVFFKPNGPVKKNIK